MVLAISTKSYSFFLLHHFVVVFVSRMSDVCRRSGRSRQVAKDVARADRWHSSKRELESKVVLPAYKKVSTRLCRRGASDDVVKNNIKKVIEKFYVIWIDWVRSMYKIIKWGINYIFKWKMWNFKNIKSVCRNKKTTIDFGFCPL